MFLPVKRMTGKNVSEITYSVRSGRINTTYGNLALSQTSVADVNCTAEYHGLAIDVGRQKLYYAGTVWNSLRKRTGKLGELSTDGTGHRVLIAANDSRPHAVVLDDVNRFETILHQHNNM